MFNLHRISVGNQVLHGIATEGDVNSPIAIHLHGTGGNFYFNAIATQLADTYRENGYRFASVNLPAYDADYRTEDFSAYRQALDAWLAHLSSGEYLLQGHSLGALKALDYVHLQDRKARCKRLVLLSAFDVVAFYCAKQVASVPQIRKRVQDLAMEGGGGTPVPKDIFDVWEISAGTFLSMTEPGGPADRFPSRVPEALASATWLPSQDVFLAIGGADFAAFPSPREVISALPAVGTLRTALIEGAPHNFDGHVSELIAEVGHWLKG